jgi:hypothetical protein
MTEAQVELAKRALACRGWRWMPGMSTSNGGRVFAVDVDGSCQLDFGAEEVPFWCTPETMSKMTPEVTDPATVGCLLALAREVWSDPYLCAVGDPDTGWRVDAVTAQVQDLHGYRIEAEALVAALEAAP